MSRELRVNLFTTTAQGLVPAPGQAKGGFLCDDGTWQAAGIPISGTTNQIVVTNGVVSLAPNVIIPAPPSGDTLTITGLASAIGVNLTSAPYFANNNTKAALQMNSVGSNYGVVGNVSSNLWGLGTATVINGAWSTALTWNAIGNVSIAAPSSGTAATISAGTNLPLELTTSSGSPWALQLTRSDLSSTIHVFNSGGVWFFNEIVNANAGLQIGGVAVTLPTTGTFTGTFTGVTGSPTAACSWTKVGNSVTLFVGASSQTGNATSYGLSGLPAAIQPTTVKYGAGPNNSVNSGAVTSNGAVIVSGSTLIFLLNGTATGWTASGTRAFGDTTRGTTIVYDLT